MAIKELVHVKQIKDPRRIQIVIEKETWRRLRRLGVGRGYSMPSLGLSSMVQEALDAWFSEQEKTS